MRLSDFTRRQQVSPSVRRRAQQLFLAVCSGKRCSGGWPSMATSKLMSAHTGECSVRTVAGSGG